MSRSPWWRRAVLYQVYVPSFADGNADGVGDLIGLADRLGYLVDLGVDAVWLSPIYPSGGADGGYDVSDFTDVDPAYGGPAAFDRFLRAAHEAGLRVLLDFVPHHTSDRHPWFVESRSSRDAPRRAWYVWADGRDGGPPNNWLSRFGGSSWRWDTATGQYYLASYYAEQPDLNWHNPDVRRAVVDAMRFWVDRGVDGFRLDVIHRLSKDRLLRDNPVAGSPAGRLGSSGSAADEEWFGQEHVYDQNGPEEHEYVREVREGIGPRTVLLGEVWMFDLERVYEFLRAEELDLAFNFPFAFADWDAEQMGSVVEQAERLAPRDAWPCYHLSNHDRPRHATRYGERAVAPAAVLLLTLRGTPVLYQGEEIGMTDGPVPPPRARDRIGRDPARTPMQWTDGANAGFCPPGVDPWLPAAPGSEQRNVGSQSRRPGSVLALYRRLLSLRRRSAALTEGSFRRMEGPPGVLVYERRAAGERLVVAVNFRSAPAAVALPEGRVLVATRPEREGETLRGPVSLGGDEALVVAAVQSDGQGVQ